MLYKFKSKNAADVIMLEPNGRQILQAIGKSPDSQGIITSSEMAQAMSALTAAIERDEQVTAPTPTNKNDDEAEEARSTTVSLRQRAAPFIELMRRSQKDGTDIVWGV